MEETPDFSRRGLIKFGLVTALAGSFASPAFAARLAFPQASGTRALNFHNLHTDERLAVSYWRDGQYDRAAWGRINNILRDHYSGDVGVMDLRVVDLLHDLQQEVGNDRPVEIISGYRSPRTNSRLREGGRGVAKQSYHMRGMAIDIRLDGTPLSRLRQTAIGMQRGGVGYYPSSDFVHIDVGPVRRWG